MVLPPLEGKLEFPKVQDDIRLILLFLPRFLASRSAVVVILLRAVVVVALAAVINGVDVIVDVIINIIAQCVVVLKSSTKQLNNERERERDEGD